LDTEWLTFTGAISPRTNAFVKHVEDAIKQRHQYFHATVLGINAIHTFKGQVPRLATSSGDEGPIKECLIERTGRELIIVVNPGKIGGDEGGTPLKAECNLPALLAAPPDRRRVRVTLLTAYPYRRHPESASAYNKRVVDFLTHLENVVRHWPGGKSAVTLYETPIYPGSIRDMTLDDLRWESGSSPDPTLRERFDYFRRSLKSDAIICVSVDHAPA
jgi:hypothetical protein